VRRDAHNIVVPVDLTNAEDMNLVVQTIQVFVKKKIPVRFGLVPTGSSPGSTAQLKVAHYLQRTYGLSSLIQYLEEVCHPKVYFHRRYYLLM
jgi:UDP-glucose:glycoprotein glucosyltransferase